MHPLHDQIIHVRSGGQSPVRNGESLATASFLNNTITVSAAALSNAYPAKKCIPGNPSQQSLVYTVLQLPMFLCPVK